jgi:hypothetical protein
VSDSSTLHSVRHNFERDPPRDHPCQVWINLVQRFQRRRFKCDLLPILELFPFLAHLAFRPCELLSSLFVRCPSVNISHFNLLLRNHWANCNQTLVEWSLDGPLPKLEDLNVIFYQNMPNLHNRYKSAERKISQKNPEHMLNYSLPCSCS